MQRDTSSRKIHWAVGILFGTALILPFIGMAETFVNLGESEDIRCVTLCAEKKALVDAKKLPKTELCPYEGPKIYPCKVNAPGGTVSGMCIFGKGCEATSASGQKGGNALDQGMQQLGQLLGKLMEMMKQGDKADGRDRYRHWPRRLRRRLHDNAAHELSSARRRTAEMLLLSSWI
jgi:hypothetical protein